MLPDMVKPKLEILVVFLKVRRPYDYIVLNIFASFNTLNGTSNFDLKYLAWIMYGR